MAAPASTLFWGGSTLLWLASPNVRENLNDLDSFDGRCISGSQSDVRPGNTLTGIEGTFIADSVTHRQLCSGQWEHTVQAAGIAIGKSQRTLEEEESPNEEGWDTARRVLLTSNKLAISLGSSYGTGSMYCVGVARRSHPVYTGWYRVEAQYKGLLSSKPQKVRVSTSAREVTHNSMRVLLPGGWHDPHKSQLILPRPTVTISEIVSNVNSIRIPSTNDHPPIAPNVIIGYMQTGASEDFTWHWPNGWTLVSHELDTIAGTNLSFQTRTWIYNEKLTM